MDKNRMIVCGFEFERRIGIKLAKSVEAIAILLNLYKYGCARIELDDSPHPVIDLLIMMKIWNIIKMVIFMCLLAQNSIII